VRRGDWTKSTARVVRRRGALLLTSHGKRSEGRACATGRDSRHAIIRAGMHARTSPYPTEWNLLKASAAPRRRRDRFYNQTPRRAGMHYDSSLATIHASPVPFI
jgi:hypothetical protein